MSTRLQRSGATLAAVVVGGSAGAALINNDQQADAVYHTPWSRQNAYDHGVTGLDEGYEYGHSKWNDNNIREDWPIEGADCSGYAGKVWAAPVYRAIGVDYSYPNTASWYAGNVDGSVQIDRSDSRTRKMDAWVMRKTSGGSSNHMGVFEGSYETGRGWKVWHAASEDKGIRADHYFQSHFDNNNMKRFKRANW